MQQTSSAARSSAVKSGQAGSGRKRRGRWFAGLRSDVRSALASYRLRIVGGFIALLALSTAGTVVVVGELQVRTMDASIQRQLQQETQELRALAAGLDPATGAPFGRDARRVFDHFLERNVPDRNEAFLTFVDGRLYRRSTAVPDYPLELDPAFVQAVGHLTESTSGRLSTPFGVVDYLAVPVRAGGEGLGVFAVAAFRDEAAAEDDAILRAAVAVGLALLFIGSALAWRLADRLLAPVLKTASTARAISESDLSRRVDVRGHDEVAVLARTFNEMLDRLESAFEDQRRFLDDAGHELRTPLTIVRGHLELINEGAPEERERTRELVLDELDRMAGLVNDLVLLAQSARPDFLRREPVRVSELLDSVHQKAVVLGDRDWRLELRGDGDMLGDRHRLSQALLQLAENAVKHTQPGDGITIGGDVDAAGVRIWVSDSGVGVASEEQAAIFERFHRGRARSHAAGHGLGLGLSIVQAIVTAHGGHVDLASRPGSGATFTMALPK